MSPHEIRGGYFNWIVNLVSDSGEWNGRAYTKLLKRMYNTPFYYIIEMDANRCVDGVDLRYRFGYEKDISDSEIKEYIDNTECSVLEVLAALALKCEEQIMSDDAFGNRVPEWFWSMISNLGLIEFTDDNFDCYDFDVIIEKWMNRDYSSDGTGGIFIVKNPPQDMRKVELWNQLCWYLDEMLNI